MPSDFFLAQTMAEIHLSIPSQTKKAWMGCHFSPYSTGLSNFPQHLPPGSMVIVTDQMPPCGHDPQRIADQLLAYVSENDCSRVLLDFQRPDIRETAGIAAAITESLPCPVGVTHWYAEPLKCPVFLPPLPLNKALSAHIAPWQNREIWLEAAVQCSSYTLTKDGCQVQSCQAQGTFAHFDTALSCHYRIEVSENAAIFTLRRNWDDYSLLAESHNIPCIVGLYQEFAHAEAQITARDH